MRRQKGRNFLVQREFPVHALGDRLDHQIAAAQLLQVVLVVGLAYEFGVLHHTQGRRLELLQAFDRLADNAVLGTFLGWQVKQHDRYPDVDQVRSNLRAHDACAENGDLSDLETRHRKFRFVKRCIEVPGPQRTGYWDTRTQTWVRPKGPKDPRTSSLAPPSIGVSLRV